MSADVHSSRNAKLRKLVGPVVKSYDDGHKMSQKRKREKAQEQLRSRIRQRIDGNGSSSTILHTKRRASLLDGKTDTTLSPGTMSQTSSVTVTPGDLLGSNYMYWRTPQDRSVPPTKTTARRSPYGTGGNETIPIQELVDRVLQRKRQNAGLRSNASPMTIKSFKPRRAPYALRHSSHVKKIVGTMSFPAIKPHDETSVVVVVRQDGSGETPNQPGDRKRLGSNSNEESNNRRNPDKDLSDGVARVLVSTNVSPKPSKTKLKTWRPTLENTQNSIDSPSAHTENGDASVSIYRLQSTQASQGNRITKTLSSGKNAERKSLHKTNPLPPIMATNSSRSGPGSNIRRSGSALVRSRSRTSSGEEILNQKRALTMVTQKAGEDSAEFTLLGTPRRFTNKTTQFKSEFERARQLSAIQEDRASARFRHLSERKSTASLTSMST